jgi:hypothetical protein
MTIRYINTGTSANKGDGDTLRTAFIKINDNFAYLAQSGGFISTGSSTSLSISPTAPTTATDGTLWFNSIDARTFVRYNGAWVDASPQITPPPTTSTETVITMGSVPPGTGEGTLWFNINDARTYINYNGAWVDSSPQVSPPPVLPPDGLGVLANDGAGTLYWSTSGVSINFTASVNFSAVESNILPATDLTYDLGSLSKQWRSLYVGTSTIYIGGVPIRLNTVSNTLIIGTGTTVQNLATEDYVVEQLVDYATEVYVAEQLANIEIPSSNPFVGTGDFSITSIDNNNYTVAGTGIADSSILLNFRIHGSVGGVDTGVDPDYVTFTTGSQPITAIYLTKYVSADARGFFAIQEGNQWTIPQDQVTPEMVAYGHFGRAGIVVGGNILGSFGPLLPNTTYTLWAQQIGLAVTEYVFATNSNDTGGNTPSFYSRNPLTPTTINPTTTVIGGELDPALNLKRGYRYNFAINTMANNFWIMTTSTFNLANAYTHGITNNGTGSGVLSFIVPGDAPDTLYYMSAVDSAMKGTINITDIGGGTSNGWQLTSGTSVISLNTSGSLTFPDATVQTTAYPGVLVPANGDSVSGNANLVFYDGSWNNTSKVGINPATGILTLNGTNGAGGIRLPNQATISVVDIGFSYTAPSNGPGGTAVQLNSLTVGIPNPGWAAAILANLNDHHIDFNGGPSNVAISSISGPAPSTNVYTLTGTWPANATGFPITIASNNYVSGGITELDSENGVDITTNGGSWGFSPDGATRFPSNTIKLESGSNLSIKTTGATGLIDQTSVTVVSSGTNYLGNSTYATDDPNTLVFIPSGPGPLVSGNFVIQSTEIFTVGDVITIPASIQGNTTATIEVTSTLPYSWAFANTGQLNLPQASNGNARIQSVADIDILSENSLWTFGTDGTLTAPGHILPDTDLAYDLGSTSSQWRSIHVGTGTIYIGGVALGLNQDNYVTVNGNPIITVNTASGSLSVQGNTNIVLGTVAISDTAPDATTPGSQWFNTVDGRTYIAYNDRWLDASPTDVPSPDTYLDEITIDGSIININDNTLTISNTGTLLINGGEVTGNSNRIENGEYSVSIDDIGAVTMETGRGTILFGNIPEVGPTGSTHFHIMKDSPSTVDLFFGDDYNYVKLPTTQGVEVGANGSTWQFGTDGTLTFPSGNLSIGNAFGSDSIVGSTGTIVGVVAQGNDGGVGLQWIDNIENIGSMSTQTLVAAVIVNGPLASTTGTVQIVTGFVNTATTATTLAEHTWEFGVDGDLTFPDGTRSTGAVVSAAQGSSYIIQTLGSANASPSNVLSTFEFGVNGTLTTPQTSSAFSLGTDFTGTIIGDGDGTGYIRVESNTGAPNFTPAPISTRFYNFLSTLTAGTEFTVNTVVDGTTYNTVVSFTEFASGNPVDTDRNDLYYTFVSGDDLPFSYNATELTLTFTSSSIVIAPTRITFPDNTVQTTAYLSGQQTILVDEVSATGAEIDITALTGSMIMIRSADGYTTVDDTHYINLPAGTAADVNIPLGTKISILSLYNGTVIINGWPAPGYNMSAYQNIDLVYIYDGNPEGVNTWWVTGSFIW